MINRREILDAATRLSLNPHVVEKDYVLGWMLAGIYHHPKLKDAWVFKGGTCLKKCFFETYRFSEDLDFTLLDPTHIDSTFLKQVFSEIGQWIYDTAGIEIVANRQEFEIYQNPRGNLSCQGKLSYRGPISPPGKNMPRVKFDLTADEKIALPPVHASVFHPYSDVPPAGIDALVYAYEEVFGEKIRALAERTRPRDLYDVINLFRNTKARPAANMLMNVLRQKCAFKNIAIPTLADLTPRRNDFAAGWQTMLEHQLPALLPLDAFWNELPSFFAWLHDSKKPFTPTAYPLEPGEKVLLNRALQLPVQASIQSAVEIICLAAFNRTCVELDYRDANERRKTFTVEPYSLRQTSRGDIFLHVHKVEENEHDRLKISWIEGVRVTQQPFVPRYEIEL